MFKINIIVVVDLFKRKRKKDEQIQELIRLRQENESLQLRLNRLACDHLTNNNPDIADLSDTNRAVQLAEQFGEIYCNKWTAAFDSLTERFKNTDRESIDLLLKILKTINPVCKSRARDQIRTLQTNVANFIGADALPHNVTVTLKILKETRKKRSPFALTAIQEEINSNLTKEIEEENWHQGELAVLENHNVRKYVLSVIKVCWLMNASDPPLVIYAKCKPGAPLDRGYFMEYVSAGNIVDFLVWPALRLCKDGSIL